MPGLLEGGDLVCLSGAEARATLETIADALAGDRLVPYLGPGLLTLEGIAPVPVEPEDVARELNRRTPVPGRIRGNMWSTAQYIENRRHRRTLAAHMLDIFDRPPRPTPLHRRLAGLGLGLIVDSWYDGTQRAALIEAGRDDFVDVQGVSRARIGADAWFDAYAADGTRLDAAAAAAAKTLLYAPHGSVRPVGNVLVSDSDYVEALTEIDIQTPIPEAVRIRRTDRGFLFLGCRFHDQMLRTYARQIVKRSAGPRYLVTEAASLSPNERRFLAAEAIVLVDLPLADAVARLAA